MESKDRYLDNNNHKYKKDIILIGVYPTNTFSKKDAIEINSKLKTICGKYNTSFIDVLALSLNEKYYLFFIAFFVYDTQ